MYCEAPASFEASIQSHYLLIRGNDHVFRLNSFMELWKFKALKSIYSFPINVPPWDRTFRVENSPSFKIPYSYK